MNGYDCDNCGKEFVSSWNLNRHMKKFHSEDDEEDDEEDDVEDEEEDNDSGKI